MPQILRTKVINGKNIQFSARLVFEKFLINFP